MTKVQTHDAMEWASTGQFVDFEVLGVVAMTLSDSVRMNRFRKDSSMMRSVIVPTRKPATPHAM